MKKLIYLFAFQIPIITTMSTYYDDWRIFIPFIELFILFPLVDLIVPLSAINLSAKQEKIQAQTRYYDFIIYFVSILWFASWSYFIWHASSIDSWLLLFAKALNVGVGCGVIGINVAHELGHRRCKKQQLLSKSLLATSLYMHFFIEHNRGHHKNVATPLDPASARFGESLYQFLPRTIFGSFKSAWEISYNKNILLNKTFHYVLIQLFMLLIIFLFFGVKSLIGVLVAGSMGILLLEVVNYIEHYGLQRKCINGEHGKYEKVSPWHSWNSDHWVGRVHLFELSRHSDHHFLANRKYQILRSLEDAPQLPTGYPGMILLSLFPRLWFKVMNPRAKAVSTRH
jgi:alkane 1-monooxygenase